MGVDGIAEDNDSCGVSLLAKSILGSSKSLVDHPGHA
jgi:hypothetical protein